MSARINVDAFKPTRSQRKTHNRSRYLERRATSPWATEDQYALFREYLDQRHAAGGRADMDVFEYAAMVEETPIRTRVIEYMDPERNALTAVALTDVLEDGLSMVYSFYTPDLPQNSLGTFMVLDHIEIAREAGLPYVYLGYWVAGSQKMGYKANFSGLEVYFGGQWTPLKDPAAFEAEDHPLSSAPIAEQVANIHLPQGQHPSKR